MAEKCCTKCKLVKPLEQFGIDRHRKSGRASRCKTCLNEQRNARYAANPQYWRDATARNRARVMADPVLKAQYAYKRKLKRVLG